MDHNATQQNVNSEPQALKVPANYDNGMYITGWCLMGCLAFYFLFSFITGYHITDKMLPCTLHTLTGLYCPGCGGTRAMISLFRGDLLHSFIYHPLVPYTAVICGWFMISQTIQRLSRNRLRIGMHYRDFWLWGALVIVAANFLLKNILLIWDIDLLAL